MNTNSVYRITIIVLSYWTISISMVFANKYVVGDKVSADMSLMASWFQCIITVVIVSSLDLYNSFMINETAFKKVTKENLLTLPVVKMSFCFVGMLSFNNMCLKLVGVSFYQVARSTTIIFVVFFSVIILKKSISKVVFGCCCLVACGFLLGIEQEKVIGSLSLLGVLFGIISSIFIALTGIFTKQALEVVEKNELHLTLLTNIIASIFFIPVILCSGQFALFIFSDKLYDMYYWTCILLTGFLGTLMSWISAKQINITSPITHHISSNTKAILQTFIAVMYYNESKNTLWWISVVLVVFGACSYAVCRYKEEQSASESLLPMSFKNNQLDRKITVDEES